MRYRPEHFYNLSCTTQWPGELSLIQIQYKLSSDLFVTYTIIQSIMRSEMCSLRLTHPSAHTPGAVGSRHCGARGAVGGSVPCSPESWTLPARAGIRTHNLGLPRVSSPTLYPLGHDCPQITAHTPYFPFVVVFQFQKRVRHSNIMPQEYVWSIFAWMWFGHKHKHTGSCMTSSCA